MSNCQCGQSRGACATEFQYAVKVVSGEVPVPQDNAQTPVAPGRYWTAVNIHNPDKCKDANYRWKVAVANPGEAGPVSPYQRTRPLTPDQAIELDNRQILGAFQPQPPRFIKGFAVIESDVELDVVAVYTGNNGPCASNSFHTERVQPRCVPVCEDLVLPLHTGIAAWQTVAPTPGVLGPVALVSPVPSGWAAPPFGAAWVSQLSSDGGSGAATNRSYELVFDLCYGFTPPQLAIQVLTDGFPSPVFLNNVQIGAGSGWTTPVLIPVPANLFRAGRNRLRVDVTNTSATGPNPTGFALAGILRVPRGKCPCAQSPAPARPPGVAGGATVEPADAV